MSSDSVVPARACVYLKESMLEFLAVEKDPLANFHSLATNPYVVRIAALTGLTVLPQHVHEVFIVAGCFFLTSALTSLITPLFYPAYKKLSPRAQHGFDMHVVSQINAVVACAISFPLFFSSKLDHLGSYTPYSGFVCAYNVGYFMWDLWITVVYHKYEGISYIAHASTALYVFLQSMHPFMMNFAAPFIWFEASTPFVNINWFAVHIPGLISDKVKLFNGLALIIVFFFCRIVSGPINGYKLFSEALVTPPAGVPKSTVYGVLSCYLVLVTLNFVWFSKMIKILIKTVKKRSSSRDATETLVEGEAKLKVE